MLSFSRSTDYPLIKSVITNERIYRDLSDDFSPKREEYEPIQNGAIWYVRVEDETGLLGFFMLHPLNAVLYEVHTALLPIAWGPKALEAARGIVVWMWENSPARRIVTSVPRYNGLAAALARRAGLAEWGVNVGAYQKSGRLHDLIMFGVSKPEAN